MFRIVFDPGKDDVQQRFGVVVDIGFGLEEVGIWRLLCWRLD